MIQLLWLQNDWKYMIQLKVFYCFFILCEIGIGLTEIIMNISVYFLLE